MARRLKLTRSELQHVNYQYLGAFRLRVDASDPSDSGADPNVFLYNRRPVNPYNGSQDDDFMSIAGPADMAEYPVGEPNGNTTYPFFRLDYFEIDFRATAQAEEAWVIIVTEVDALLKALDRMEQLTPTVEVWVGGQPDSGGSESGSTSASTGVV